MSLTRKILSNTVAQIAGKALLALLGLAVVKISTNYLTIEGFGEYTAIYEFLAYFGIAADLGLFTVAVKEMSEKEDQIPKIIGNILTLRTILTVLMLTAAVISAFFVNKFEGTHIPLGVAIASITVFFTILNGTITSVLQTKLKMGLSSVATVIGKIVSVLFMVYIAFFGFPQDNVTGFYMLIVAGNIGAITMFFITNYHVRKITPLKYRFDLDLWIEILKKSIPYGIALILSTIYFRIDSLFILFMHGKSELGIYAVAMRMLEQIAIIPLFFMNSVLPVLTKTIKEKSEQYKTVIKYAFDFLAALSVPMVVGGVLLAYPIVFVVSKPEYLSRISEGFYGSDIVFQILIFASLFQFLNVLFSFILIAVDKQSKMLYINGACVIFKIITSAIFIPIYGIRAAAITSVIAEFFILLLTFAAAHKYVDFTVSYKNLLKIIFSSLTMGAAIYLLQPLTYKFLQNWNIMLLIPLSMALYGGMLLLTKTIDKEALRLLKKTPEHLPPPVL